MPSTYDRLWTIFDYFRGEGSESNNSNESSFVTFVDQGGTSFSGESVTVDNILEEPTSLACINAITQGVTQIPIQVRRKNDDGTSEVIRDHSLMRLMNRPNDFQTPTEFKSSIVTSMLTHGNAFIFIARSKDGTSDNIAQRTQGVPVFLIPMDPSEITLGSGNMGRPTYRHNTYGDIPRANMIHIRDLHTFIVDGLSRALLMSDLIANKIAADRLIGTTFGNGTSLNYVVRSDVPLDSDRVEAMQDQLRKFANNSRGGRSNVMFIEQGAVENLKGITPADVDLRELREQLIREIAAGFRVPEMMAGGTGDQKYNNVRQQWTAFHRDTLHPITRNIGEAMSLKLLGPDEFIFFDIDELLKGDVEVTSRIAQGYVQAGIWTPNEARNYIGTAASDDPMADMLIRPNSSSNENTNTTINENGPDAATGGEDGPQGGDNPEGVSDD